MKAHYRHTENTISEPVKVTHRVQHPVSRRWEMFRCIDTQGIEFDALHEQLFPANSLDYDVDGRDFFQELANLERLDA